MTLNRTFNSLMQLEVFIVALSLCQQTSPSKHLPFSRKTLSTEKRDILWGNDASSAAATAPAATANNPLLSLKIVGNEAKDRHRRPALCGKKDGS